MVLGVFLSVINGFLCVAELVAWDVRLERCVRRLHKFPHLECLLRKGGFVTSSFTGWDAAREGMRVWFTYLSKQNQVIKKLRWVTSCDIGKVQQRCLKKLEERHGNHGVVS